MFVFLLTSGEKWLKIIISGPKWEKVGQLKI